MNYKSGYVSSPFFTFFHNFSTLLYATQALRVSRGIAVLFSRPFDTKWGWGGQPHAPTASTPLERPGTHCTVGWVGHNVSGRAENLVPTGIRSRTVQPVAQSLYLLSYPAHGINHSSSRNIAEEHRSRGVFRSDLSDMCVRQVVELKFRRRSVVSGLH